MSRPRGYFGTGERVHGNEFVADAAARFAAQRARAEAAARGDGDDHPAAHGALALSRLHFGISQTVSAPSISVSAVTVEGRLCLTVQYATPIWSEADAEAYTDGVARALELAAAQAD